MPRSGPYVEVHKAPQGPNDERPTASQIVRDQGLVANPEWAGRVVLITGCSPGGLGPEIARALHLTGADIFMTARDTAKTEQLARDILSDGGPGKVEVLQMDLDSLESIRSAANELLRSSGDKLHVLINNAGVMFCPEAKTKDGFEMHFGVNHLGHFYLFHLLRDALMASSSDSLASRVISVSSAGHRYAKINFDDLNFQRTPYDAQAAYFQSKLANVYFANELDRRYRPKGIRALTVHPGGIITPLGRHMQSTKEIEGDPEIAKMLATPAQGASTSVWAAVAKELEGRGGLYLDEDSVSELAPPDAVFYASGYGSNAFDPDAEERLWVESLKLVGLSE